MNRPLAGEPEGIHQMRVAIRRLRSALLALKRPLQKKHYRWASEELRWIAHALAPVRNLDVFAASLVRPVTQALSPAWTLNASSTPRSAGGVQFLRRLNGPSCPKGTLNRCYDLLRWFVIRGWRDQQISEHAVDVADLARCDMSFRGLVHAGAASLSWPHRMWISHYDVPPIDVRQLFKMLLGIACLRQAEQ